VLFLVDSKNEVLNLLELRQAARTIWCKCNITVRFSGAALDIRIRGIATNGDAKPLTIIDGYIGELGL
jgi:hypothetical protein